MTEKTPVMMLFPINSAKKLSSRFLFIGSAISKIIYSLPYDLKNAEIKIDAERYSLAALISAFIYFIIFILIGIAFGFVISRSIDNNAILIAVIIGFFAFVVSFFFHLYYPRILGNKIARSVESDLLYALRTLLIQVSSGISLFQAMRVISRSNYGQVSEEFKEVIKDINSGMSETKALEKLAFKTKSEIFKKVIWQMLTTIKSGGSVVASLRSSVNELVESQMEMIKGYAATLNMWTLIYLIIAAALPSLGVTFLVIASSIGGSGIGVNSVLLIVTLAICIQFVLIIVLRSQVPKVIK